MNAPLSLKDKLAASKEASKDEAKKEDADAIKSLTAPEGAYLAVRMQQIIKADGSKMKPDAHGFYIPKDQEELDLLEYFEKAKWNSVVKC